MAEHRYVAEYTGKELVIRIPCELIEVSPILKGVRGIFVPKAPVEIPAQVEIETTPPAPSPTVSVKSEKKPTPLSEEERLVLGALIETPGMNIHQVKRVIPVNMRDRAHNRLDTLWKRGLLTRDKKHYRHGDKNQSLQHYTPTDAALTAQ